HYYPHQLSGGMKQRVAIARALALKSEIILMDEPFAALDALTRRELQNELLTLSATEHRTILFVTHNIQEAVILGTRNIVLQKGGKIIFDEKNTLPKPSTPSSPGFAEVWQRMRDAIYANEDAE
ncbi:MAG: ATP-binding cassette domain-containing protein, partial [Lachnospiraceae bacterium]|nr:ATP-binding cassette domain-containing protein [Lachnospiraceae bacterium]